MKTKSEPLEPPCPKPLYSKLSVIWLEQQGKYIGLKIKKSGGYYNFLPKRHIFSFFFFLFLR
jgi:hypothetical protein